MRAKAMYTLGFFLWVGSSACTTTKMTPAAENVAMDRVRMLSRAVRCWFSSPKTYW